MSLSIEKKKKKEERNFGNQFRSSHKLLKCVKDTSHIYNTLIFAIYASSFFFLTSFIVFLTSTKKKKPLDA